MKQLTSVSTTSKSRPTALKVMSSKEDSKLKAIRRITGELKKMGKALAFSKEDVHLYAHILYSIFQQHPPGKIQTKAERFLTKQLKVEEILEDLIIRHQFLKNHWKSNLSHTPTKWKEITQQFFQLEEEIRIFNEIHFFVKRDYIRFTHEQFQLEYRQPSEVA